MQHVHPTVSLFAAPEKLTSLMESGVSTIAFTSNWGDPTQAWELRGGAQPDAFRLGCRL